MVDTYLPIKIYLLADTYLPIRTYVLIGRYTLIFLQWFLSLEEIFDLLTDGSFRVVVEVMYYKLIKVVLTLDWVDIFLSFKKSDVRINPLKD